MPEINTIGVVAGISVLAVIISIIIGVVLYYRDR